MGIPPDALEAPEDATERAAAGPHYGGLGLGLYITHQIVQALGGEIRVQSTLGEGALFEVTLPQHLGLSQLTPVALDAAQDEAAAPH